MVDHQIVSINGYVVHNVRQDVFTERMISSMIYPFSVPLVKDLGDLIPEGPVSKNNYFLNSINSNDSVDPKLNFSGYIQVHDKDRFWQWHVADFESIPEKPRGKMVSKLVDLDPLESITDKYVELSEEVKKTQLSIDDKKRQISQFYGWVEEIRRPIMQQLKEYHDESVKDYSDFKKVVDVTQPPLISRFEQFTVTDRQFQTKLLFEPILFRACCQHAEKAEEATRKIETLITSAVEIDEVFQDRAIAIIMGAACLEAFLYSIGVTKYPDSWEILRDVDQIDKWQLFYSLIGKKEDFDARKEPFKSLKEIIEKRNKIVHFQFGYKNLSGNKTFFEFHFSREFVNSLPDKVTAIIQAVSSASGFSTPQWLNKTVATGSYQLPSSYKIDSY